MKRYIVGLILMFVVVGMTSCQTEQGGLVATIPLKPTASVISSDPPTPMPDLPTASQPMPTLTPVQTPTLQQFPSILLREDFSSDNTCMESFDNSIASAEVVDGVYILDVKDADAIVNANCETLVVGDFRLEVDVIVEAVPPSGSYYFGLIFRVSGQERYAFIIGNEGGYCVYYASDQSFVTLTNSTDFEVPCWVSIPENAKAVGTQRLQVIAVDERIDLYLNGELLTIVRDSMLREGWVGFVVATAGGGGVRVVFDNLVVVRP